MNFITRSPTRVDFAGGTLDCWPLHVLAGGAQTTNLAISVFSHVELTPQSGSAIEVDVRDMKFKKKFNSAKELLQSTEAPLAMVQALVRYWQPPTGFHLVTRSESPIGAGLGGSSSLCVSLIKAFSSWLKKPDTVLNHVHLAHNLEAEILRKPTGTQDYVPALTGGLTVIHYRPEGMRLEKLGFETEYFAKRLLLVYTGQPHHSGLNNWQVIKAAVEGDTTTLNALNIIKDIGDQVAEACRQRQWDKLPDLFRKEFEGRVKLSAGFTSTRIEELKKLTLNAGAEAVKICGAGGGGCVLVWTAEERKAAVAEVCRQNGFQILDAAPVAE